MNDPEEITPPVVFISYSHDSDEHKDWVVQFACELREAGIDVRFDEWDTGPGDDLAKFMEKSVAESDRVVMVCTESYVRKVDEGEGGAGYEAMVVTGEIIRDQATRKFIPVIRQLGGDNKVPRCVSTRRYIDLSNEEDRLAGWESLIRDIHQSPKLVKPALGVNPFNYDSVPAPALLDDESHGKTESNNVSEVFRKAQQIIQADDLLAWRKLVEKSKSDSVSGLLRWKKEKGTNFPAANKELPSYMVGAVSAYAPVFAVAIAGVQSGEEKYAKQVGLIDWILDPPGWAVQGRAEINMIPELIVFVYQAVLGATAIHSGQSKLAFELANARLRSPWDPPGESILLFKSTKFIGWPTSMNRNCSLGWIFLDKLLTEWEWLSQAFGNDEILSAVHAHYLFLNLLDFISSAKRHADNGNIGEARGPLYVGVAADRVWARSYSVLLLSGDFIKELLEENGISQRDFERLWPEWIHQSNMWVKEVCKSHRGDELPHKFLYRDLISRGGDLTID